MAKLSRDALMRLQKETPRQKDYIAVGMSTCGIAAGAEEVFAVFSEEIKKRNLAIEVKKCGCIGMCHAEPLVEVRYDNVPSVIYGKVNKEVAMKILEKHITGKMLVNDFIVEVKGKE
jgi:(2Fe-2S) ferredoxin